MSPVELKSKLDTVDHDLDLSVMIWEHLVSVNLLWLSKLQKTINSSSST